jgi:Cd2+/Zn2+-exporting ATPase
MGLGGGRAKDSHDCVRIGFGRGIPAGAFPATERWAFLIAMLVGLILIGRRAISAAFTGTPFSIEMLMTIAAIGAVFIGATEEAAAVVFLFLIGELLEGVAADRARASIQNLTELIPKTARLEENGQVREVQADTLTVGAMIQVRPGDRIPADGIIVSGESSIDEAPVSGKVAAYPKGARAKTVRRDDQR